MGRDLRHALRTLRRAPGFTAATLLTLALGIGATCAVFSVVEAVLLRPLPFPHAERIVRLWSAYTQRDVPPFETSEGELLDYRDQNRVLDAIGGYVSVDGNLTGGGQEPERVAITYATAGLFPVLGASPLAGRVYDAEEDGPGGPPVAVLSDRLWQRRFASDPGIVGKPIQINGRAFTVLGVLPSSRSWPEGTEIWIPLGIDPAHLTPRSQHYLTVLARLDPGVGVARAQADLNAIAARFSDRFPQQYPADLGWGVRLVPLRDEIVGDSSRSVLVLLVAVGLVLLVACVNVANLLLARARSREREMAVRVALGAGGRRLLAQSVTEALTLSIFGGALGLALAQVGLTVLLAIDPKPVPRAGGIGIDPAVLAFALGLVLATGLVLGLVPAFRASRTELREHLKEGGAATTTGRRGQRFRKLLVGVEVALALVLLVGAGLMIESFRGLTRIDPGFDSRNLLTMEMSLPRAKYGDDVQVSRMYERILDRLSQLPRVESAGAISYLPFSDAIDRSATVGTEGQPFTPGDLLPEPQWRSADAGYFRTMGIPLAEGRSFTPGDDTQAPLVVVLDEVLAHRLWPDESPLGRRLKIGPPVPQNTNPWLTVVGVVREAKQRSLAAEPQGVLYYPDSQHPMRTQFLVLRSRDRRPLDLVPDVRAALHELDPDQPISDVRTMEERISQSLARQRFSTVLLGLFAAVAAVLAAVGLYGVIAYAVAQRTQEIGVRLALGARRASIFRLVVVQGMMLAVAGILAGLVAAFWAARGLSGLLYGVAVTDAAVFATVPVLLAAVAFAANLLPAWRAARLEPRTALRYE